MKRALSQTLIVILGTCSVLALVNYVPMEGFAFAWSLNFLLMIFVAAFIESLKNPLASSYYDQKKWERRGKVYEHLGINFFRKLLVWTGWERLIRKSNPVEKNAEALIHLHNQTKKSELGHLIILVLVSGFNFFVAFKFGFSKSLWLLVLNILLNLYPVLLQRYNRPRLARIIKLSKR